MRHPLSAGERLAKDPPCLVLKVRHKQCGWWASLVLLFSS
jgi:hypothetical protein